MRRTYTFVRRTNFPEEMCVAHHALGVAHWVFSCTKVFVLPRLTLCSCFGPYTQRCLTQPLNHLLWDMFGLQNIMIKMVKKYLDFWFYVCKVEASYDEIPLL